MTEQIDQAQMLEQQFRDIALDRARQNRHTESPDIDNGIRYCLDCACEIPSARIEAEPNAVRCVRCQSDKE